MILGGKVIVVKESEGNFPPPQRVIGFSFSQVCYTTNVTLMCHVFEGEGIFSGKIERGKFPSTKIDRFKFRGKFGLSITQEK